MFANRSSNVFWIVAVSTNVPDTNPTPSTTATPVSRNRSRAVREPFAQPDRVDHLVEPSLVGPAAGERGGQRDVLERIQRRDQVVRLEDEADAVAADLGELLLGQRADVDVAEEYVTAREPV